MWATSPCESPSRSGFRTRPASARRTGSCDNGRGAEHGQDSQPTSVTRAPTCSARSARRAAPAPPWRCPQAMQLHLDEIARTVKRGAHAALLLDRAGWHTSGALAIPQNMTLILLPARAPELNPVENIWQYLRQTWLSNRVFNTYEEIIEAACEAWRRLIAQPNTNASIGSREWAPTGKR